MPGPNRRMHGPKAKNVKGSLARLLKLLFSDYKWRLAVVSICLLLGSVATSISAVFINNLVKIVKEGLAAESFSAVSGKL